MQIDWATDGREQWLLSLGLTRDMIRLYRLDQYRTMTEEAWKCMVREALRSHTSLHNEQYRRKGEKHARPNNR